MTVYASDPFQYDFGAALAAVRAAAGERRKAQALDADADERAYYEHTQPLPGAALDGTFRRMEAPTLSDLERHEKRFMPPDNRLYRDARTKHRQAVQEVRELYGGSETTDEKRDEARALYAQGWPIPDIATEIGLSRPAVIGYVKTQELT
jgi:hypothetical protein